MNRGLLHAAMVAMGAACLVSEVEAHIHHVTMAEMEYNRERHCFEVSVRITPEDMERALTLRTQSQVNLERTAEVDSLITGYLREWFCVTTAEGDSLSLIWVGKEVSHRALWVYFELPWRGAVADVVVTNSMFFDLEPTQVNTVTLKEGPNRVSWSFSPG